MYIKGEMSKIEFAKYLNGKAYWELIPNFKKFIKLMYPDIQEGDVISCVYVNNGKVDIEVSCQSVIKRVMIKSGTNCLLHMEDIYNFTNFLSELNVSYEVINNLLFYYFGENIDDQQRCSKLSGKDIYLNHRSCIKIVNEALNKKELAAIILSRILKYDYYHKKIHYLYYGNLLTGVAISMERLLDLLSVDYAKEFDYIHIANINFCTLNRNIQSERSVCGFKVGNLYNYLVNKNDKSNP